MAKNKIVDLVFPFLGPLIAPVLKAKSLTIVGFLVCILAIIIVLYQVLFWTFSWL